MKKIIIDKKNNQTYEFDEDDFELAEKEEIRLESLERNDE